MEDLKLVVAVIQDKDAVNLLQLMAEEGFRATKLSSTGGFLREGNTTLLIGCEADSVERVLDLIRENCRPRERTVTAQSPPSGMLDSYAPFPLEVSVGGATVFVLDVEKCVQI